MLSKLENSVRTSFCIWRLASPTDSRRTISRFKALSGFSFNAVPSMGRIQASEGRPH